MQNRTRGALGGFLAGIAGLAVGSAGCGSSTTTSDTAYEDSYATAYTYPADVAYAGAYAVGGFAYGIYLATPGGAVAAAADGGAPVVGGGVRQAVGEAIRTVANGGSICPGQVTVTPQMGTPACATTGTTSARTGLNIVFSGCQLPGGGTVDGSVTVQLARS